MASRHEDRRHLEGLLLRGAAPPRTQMLHSMAVDGRKAVAVRDDGPGCPPCLVERDAHAAALPGEHVDQAVGFPTCRRRALDSALPTGQVVCEQRGLPGQVEQNRFLQRRTRQVDPAELPGPRRADRVTLAALDCGVAQRAGLDPRCIERLQVHEPPSRLRCPQPSPRSGLALREMGAGCDVRKQSDHRFRLSACGAVLKIRDLIEGKPTTDQEEAVVVRVEVLSDVRRERFRAPQFGPLRLRMIRVGPVQRAAHDREQ